MRELDPREACAVVGGDGDDSCTQVAAAVTTVVGATVGSLASPLTTTGSVLLGLGGITVFQATENICINLTTPAPPVDPHPIVTPLPFWMMYMLPWSTTEEP